MKRAATALSVLLTVFLTVLAAGCGGGDSDKSTATGTATGKSVEAADITLWVGFSARELGVFKDVVADFEKEYPQIHVKVVGNISDDKIVTAIRGGNAPDVAQSFSSDNTGAFCSTGAWIDLGDYMERDGVDPSVFPEVSQYYTEYDGKRCALPVLADTYGLYYNKDLFAKAGLSGPPKTISELTEYAKKLTEKNPDGSLKVVGFDPISGFYENAAAHYGPSWGAKWIDDEGKSTLSTDPGWAKYLQWKKDLIDWYGYDNLVKFQTGAGDEFSPSNAFERGKLAMNMDGEWRVAFIENETPDLNYATAPFPVADESPDLYGAGYVTGSIVGIPKTSDHKDQAWELLKYLATDDHALATLSNGIRNVPTTTSSLTSDELEPDPNFATFLDVFGNENSSTTPITLVGAANQELFEAFVAKWQAGRISDLQAGLANVDEQIDAQLENAAGGQVP
ncbi:MAG TPA: ABC transporter substrate-binding protein [Gaiellaceae bacterium]|jgi:multiple sugar transport system substrate-binding protein|nr:ABC transporter substrate-binding protein [Gaiellaceae bacterium]